MLTKHICGIVFLSACTVACEPHAGFTIQEFVVRSGEAIYRIELKVEQSRQNPAQGRHLRVSCVFNNGHEQNLVEVTTNYSPNSDLKLNVSDFRGYGNGRLKGTFDDQTMLVFAPCARAKWISQRSDWRITETTDSLHSSRRHFGDVQFCGAGTAVVTILTTTQDSSNPSSLFVTEDAGVSWSVEPISVRQGCQ